MKTSPEGMLRLPSELIHVRPSTDSAVAGALGLDAQLAGALQPLDQPRPEAALAQAAGASARSRNSARRTKAA